jgi:hypothetical protein
MDIVKDLKENNRVSTKRVLEDLRDLLRKTISIELGISDIEKVNTGLEKGYLYAVPQKGLSVKFKEQLYLGSIEWVFYRGLKFRQGEPFIHVEETKDKFSDTQSFLIRPLSHIIEINAKRFLIFSHWRDVREDIEKAIMESTYNREYRLELDMGSYRSDEPKI